MYGDEAATHPGQRKNLNHFIVRGEVSGRQYLVRPFCQCTLPPATIAINNLVQRLVDHASPLPLRSRGFPRWVLTENPPKDANFLGIEIQILIE